MEFGRTRRNGVYDGGMKINRKELLAALKLAARVAPTKSPKPVLQNVHLEADGARLIVTATDLELYSRTELKGGGSAKWKRLVSAKDARDLIKALPDETVELRPAPDSLSMIVGGSMLVGDEPEMFPVFPEVNDTRGVDLPAVDLPAVDFKRMIDDVRYAAAREGSRYMINGVLMELKDSKLRLVATDGRRLAITERAAGSDDGPIHAVVPVDALNALRVSIGKDKAALIHVETADAVWCSHTMSWVQFTWGNSTLISRSLECKFPDYSCVIPRDPPIFVDVERKPLEAAIKRLMVHTVEDLPLITFDVGCDEHLTLTAEAAGRGKGEVILKTTGEGEGRIAFAPDYVLDALKASTLETIRLRFTDSDTPAVFDLGFTYVLMPVSGT